MTSEKELFEIIEYRGHDILMKVESYSGGKSYNVTVRTPMNTPPGMALFYEEKSVDSISQAKSLLREWFAEATTELDRKEADSKELQEVAESLREAANDLEQKQIQLNQYLGRFEQQKNM